MKIIQIHIKLLLILASCLLVVNSIAQQVQTPKKNVLFVEPGFKVGKMIDIFPGAPKARKSYFTEVNIGWQTIGKQWWNSYFHFPRVGILLSYGSLGNKEVLGNNISILPNMSLKLIGNTKVSFYTRIGLGFSWFMKPFDRIENPENIFIGSSITQTTQISFDLNVRLTDRLIFSTGVSVQHFSTGHVQIPNIGINIPSFNLGLIYYPNNIPKQFHSPDTVIGFEKKILFNLQIGLGVHEFAPTTKASGGPKYPVYGGAFYISKRLGVIFNIQLGMHVNYYTSFYDYIINQDFYTSNQRVKSFTVTPFVGAELYVGRFGFNAQLGIYAYNPFVNDMIEHLKKTGGKNNFLKRVNANRLGAKYYLLDAVLSGSKKPYLGLFIKTNAGQADFVELCFGYAF